MICLSYPALPVEGLKVSCLCEAGAALGDLTRHCEDDLARTERF